MVHLMPKAGEDVVVVESKSHVLWVVAFIRSFSPPFDLIESVLI